MFLWLQGVSFFIISNNENQKHFMVSGWQLPSSIFKNFSKITSKWPKYNTKCYLKKNLKSPQQSLIIIRCYFPMQIILGGLKVTQCNTNKHPHFHKTSNWFLTFYCLTSFYQTSAGRCTEALFQPLSLIYTVFIVSHHKLPVAENYTFMINKPVREV